MRIYTLIIIHSLPIDTYKIFHTICFYFYLFIYLFIYSLITILWNDLFFFSHLCLTGHLRSKRLDYESTFFLLRMGSVFYHLTFVGRGGPVLIFSRFDSFLPSFTFQHTIYIILVNTKLHLAMYYFLNVRLSLKS